MAMTLAKAVFLIALLVAGMLNAVSLPGSSDAKQVPALLSAGAFAE